MGPHGKEVWAVVALGAVAAEVQRAAPREAATSRARTKKGIRRQAQVPAVAWQQLPTRMGTQHDLEGLIVRPGACRSVGSPRARWGRSGEQRVGWACL